MIKISTLIASMMLVATAQAAPADNKPAPASTSPAGTAPASTAPASTERTGPLAPDVFVNGVAISKGQVELLMQTLLSNDGDQEKGDVASRRQSALKELVTQETLSQLALTEGLEKDPEVSDAIDHARREILSRVYIQNFFQTNPVTDAMLKSGYEWNRSNGKIMEYRVRQILLPTREEAMKVLARLKKGEDFIALTKLTRDPGGNTNGGYISKDGWFRTDIFVDPYFTDEVEAMAKKKGQYSSKPIRTRFGWHVVKVEDTRVMEKPEPFEKLHPNVLEAMRQKLAQRKLNELIASSAAKAKLTDANGKTFDFSALSPKP